MLCAYDCYVNIMYYMIDWIGWVRLPSFRPFRCVNDISELRLQEHWYMLVLVTSGDPRRGTGGQAGRGSGKTRGRSGNQGDGRIDGQGGQVGGQGGEVNDGVNEVPDFSTIIAQILQILLPTIVAQVGDQGRGQRNGRNQNEDGINDNIWGDVSRGCTYKEFLACNLKEYDGKGGAIMYTRWIEKMESVLDMSGCKDNQKVKYTAGSFVVEALTWWNSQIHTRGREAVVGMFWEDFKILTIEEFFPSNEIQKLEIKLWNHAMVGAGHAAYRFHELARLVPHLVTPKGKKIERNGSIKKNLKKKGNKGEPSKDRNVRDDNKKTRTGNAFATTTNPVKKENTGTVPKCTTCNTHHLPGVPCRTCFNYNRPDHFAKDCRMVPRNVNPINARNLTIRACRSSQVSMSYVESGSKARGKPSEPSRGCQWGSRSWEPRESLRIPLLDGKVLRVLGEKPEDKVRQVMSARTKEQKQEEIIVMKDFPEGEEQENVFQTLKDKLCNAPVVALLDGSKYFIVYYDASSDYDCEFRYHPDKANVVADVLSRKERVKPKRARAMNITFQSSINDRILATQKEASDESARLQKGIDEMIKLRNDGALYYLDQIWVPFKGDVRTLIMDEAHKSKYYVHPGADKMYYDLRDRMDRLARLYLNEIVARHGVSILIISDRNSWFTSRFYQSMQKALGTRLDMSTAYHPQTDGLSKHTIQICEDMLRACILDFEGIWEDHLRLAEKCCSLILWAEVGEGQLIEPELVQETTEKILQIKDRLKSARDRLKSYADKRRKPLEFSVGDYVLLKVSLWKVVYRLDFPEELNDVHDTFHVSNLKKYLADPTLQVPLDEI
uniref:Reverse transcriptase domain-containing protein n=1 Tax=Tanacetum cinerariifolium TaxID=118510 RepID=A0A6L2K2I1_TANCI|nr:reverse transcriptase domain-containing protein [Tanacetum cinerariifolium]